MNRANDLWFEVQCMTAFTAHCQRMFHKRIYHNKPKFNTFIELVIFFSFICRSAIDRRKRALNRLFIYAIFYQIKLIKKKPESICDF